MGYVWDVGGDGHVVMHADYFSGRNEELHGEIAVTLRGTHLHLARFNLSSSTSRKTLERALAAQTNRSCLKKDRCDCGLCIPWDKLVERFSVGVLRMEREGEPTLYTEASERRRLVYTVDRLVIQGKSNMLFAPGGSGKGFLTVALCCAVSAHRGVAGLSVMPATPFYFDWEDDFETFQERLNVVATGMEVPVPRIAYRRMRGLAADRINEMARAVTDAGANFGIIDSFSAAGGTVSQHSNWDTIAHRLFDALDQVPVPNMTWLLIDHVTGDSLKDPSGKAYGSIQKMNRVRNAWEMRSDQEPGSPNVHMRLYHAKWNHTGRKPTFGVRMGFSGETVTFCAEDPVQAVDEGGTLADRMALELDRGPLSTGTLAMSLKVKPEHVRAELTRYKDRFSRDDRGFIRLRLPDAPEPPEELPW